MWLAANGAKTVLYACTLKSSELVRSVALDTPCTARAPYTVAPMVAPMPHQATMMKLSDLWLREPCPEYCLE